MGEPVDKTLVNLLVYRPEWSIVDRVRLIDVRQRRLLDARRTIVATYDGVKESRESLLQLYDAMPAADGTASPITDSASSVANMNGPR